MYPRKERSMEQNGKARNKPEHKWEFRARSRRILQFRVEKRAKPGDADEVFGIKQSWSLRPHTQTLIKHLHVKKRERDYKIHEENIDNVFYKIILSTPISKATIGKTGQIDYKNITPFFFFLGSHLQHVEVPRLGSNPHPRGHYVGFLAC